MGRSLCLVFLPRQKEEVLDPASSRVRISCLFVHGVLKGIYRFFFIIWMGELMFVRIYVCLRVGD